MDDDETEESPLLKALPPATDYMTYLTILEYNLKKDNLDQLNDLLQDGKLTVNIGWDLVQLLVPLLPESQTCLETVARLGNPREVQLKVAEILQDLAYTDGSGEELESDSTDHIHEVSPNSQQLRDRQPLPLPVLKYQTMLSMLSVSHSRLKVKRPSQFVSMSLQAVLTALRSFSRLDLEAVTLSALSLIDSLRQSTRPNLPPRGDSSTKAIDASAATEEPDPEAQLDPPSAEDHAITNRLLQAFLTHVLETYLNCLNSKLDVPGMNWASRLYDHAHTERIIPLSESEEIAVEQVMQRRARVLDRIVNLSNVLGIEPFTTLKVTFQELSDAGPGSTSTTKDDLPGLERENELEPPSKADDVPLSLAGTLCLFCAREASTHLAEITPVEPLFEIFPQQARILPHLIESDNGFAGSEAGALIDAVLALGILAVQADKYGATPDAAIFNNYLRTMSLLSANTPSPKLRYLAHHITTRVLRSHPSDMLRLAFIADTLQNCPYENLKASAVEWIKLEIIEANPADSPQSDEISLFTTSAALKSVSPYLFPDIRDHLEGQTLSEKLEFLMINMGFYLAALNFYYFLVTANHLRNQLNIDEFQRDMLIRQGYLEPLQRSSTELRDGICSGLPEFRIGEAYTCTILTNLSLLDDVLGRIQSKTAGFSNSYHSLAT